MDNESTTTDVPQTEVTDQQTLPAENNLDNTSRRTTGGSREHSYLRQ